MPTVYAEFDCTPGTVVAEVRSRILATGDWTELTPPGGSTVTTAQTAGGGANTLPVASVAGLTIGQTIAVGFGASIDYRVITGFSGNTIQFGFATWTYAHPVGDPVVLVNRILKATTAAGAQMCVDLLATGPKLNGLAVDVYRTHDGTTGVDKVTRYAVNKLGTPAATDVIHAVVSVGKEHLYVSVEGPRAGETNPDNATGGSTRGALLLCSLTPYFDNDTVPAVVLMGGSSATNAMGDSYVHVSRNAANGSSWVQAKLGTVAFPAAPRGDTSVVVPATFAQRAAADGNHYFFPFVVVEHVDGLRGRLSVCLDAGYNASLAASEPIFTPGQRYTVGGVDYVAVAPIKGSTSGPGWCPLGYASALSLGGVTQTIVLVPR